MTEYEIKAMENCLAAQKEYIYVAADFDKVLRSQDPVSEVKYNAMSLLYNAADLKKDKANDALEEIINKHRGNV